MRLDRLPGWVVDDVASVRAEVEPYVGLSPEELWRVTEACSRAAAWALRASDVRAEALAHRDPLPESTTLALRRLRERAGR